jgi:fatty acid desaturase
MDLSQRKTTIDWYRVRLSRETLSALNQRSDWKGLFQAGGHLGLLMLTGGAAWYAAGHLPLAVLLLILFLHGTFYAFLLNGFHELCHSSVFKTKFLNTLFLYIYSFLGWLNPVGFWTSHVEHHKYTLHPPDDLEVVLPMPLTVADFLKVAIVNPWGLWARIKGVVRLSRGRLEGEWENALFPESAPDRRRRLFTWARILLVGHGLIVVVSLAFGWWLIPVLVTLAPFYGGGLQWLCNNTQHIGLQDNVPDFRLCTRTIYLNPFVRFLYWQMNYHIEHHMYAAVPCYNLGKLHELIKHELPHCPNGLIEAWREIIEILRRQREDPQYQYVPALPTTAPVAAGA